MTDNPTPLSYEELAGMQEANRLRYAKDLKTEGAFNKGSWNTEIVGRILATIDARDATIAALKADLDAMTKVAAAQGDLKYRALSDFAEQRARAEAAEAEVARLRDAIQKALVILRGKGVPGWGVVKDILGTALAPTVPGHAALTPAQAVTWEVESE